MINFHWIMALSWEMFKLLHFETNPLFDLSEYFKIYSEQFWANFSVISNTFLDHALSKNRLLSWAKLNSRFGPLIWKQTHLKSMNRLWFGFEFKPNIGLIRVIIMRQFFVIGCHFSEYLMNCSDQLFDSS